MNLQESFRIIQRLSLAHNSGSSRDQLINIFKEEMSQILVGPPFFTQAQCVDRLTDFMMDPEEGDLRSDSTGEGEELFDLSYLNNVRRELFNLLSS